MSAPISRGDLSPLTRTCVDGLAGGPPSPGANLMRLKAPESSKIQPAYQWTPEKSGAQRAGRAGNIYYWQSRAAKCTVTHPLPKIPHKPRTFRTGKRAKSINCGLGSLEGRKPSLHVLQPVEV